MNTTKMIHKENGVIRAMRRVVAGTVLASSIMLAAKPVRADSIELMAGQKSATVDMKASAELTKKAGVLIRARPSQDFSTGNITSFGLVDLTLNMAPCFDAVAEVQFSGGAAVPRAGAQNYTSVGDLSLYEIATVGLDNKPYVEILVTATYTPSLSDGLKLLIRIENINDFDKTGNNWSTQRGRLGVGISGWGIGTALDLTETGNHPKTSDGSLGWNAGGFVSKNF